MPDPLADVRQQIPAEIPTFAPIPTGGIRLMPCLLADPTGESPTGESPIRHRAVRLTLTSGPLTLSTDFDGDGLEAFRAALEEVRPHFTGIAVVRNGKGLV